MAWTYNLNERRNQNGQSKASRQWGLGTMLVNQTANGRQNGEYQKFKIYRLVNLGKVNNGVFGSEQAFLTENDAGAYLSMRPFPVCQSTYYLDALNDIILHLRICMGPARIRMKGAELKQMESAAVSYGDCKGKPELQQRRPPECFFLLVINGYLRCCL